MKAKEIINYIKSLSSNEVKERKKIKLSELKFLFPYIKKNWKDFLKGSVLVLFISSITLPFPLLTKHIIDNVLPAKNFKMLHVIVLSILTLYIVKSLLTFLNNYFFTKLNQKITIDIKKDFFSNILRLPLSFFDNKQVGYIMSRVYEVESLQFFFSGSTIRLVISLFEFVLCLVILFYMNWRLTLISLFILPLYYVVIKKHSKIIMPAQKNLMENSAKVSTRLQESLSGIDTVKVFAAEERETGKLSKGLNEYMKTSIINSAINSFSSEIIGFIGILGGNIVLWYSCIEIMKGDFTLGGYVAFAAYLVKLYNPTRMVASYGLGFQRASVALGRVKEILNMVEKDEGNGKTGKIEPLNERIEFKDIRFTYSEKNKQVFTGLNLTLDPGEKVLIVGQNGSGKSTLIKLLLGLYPVENGKILIGGKDLKTLNRQKVREKISVVSQNIFLFNDSILENIRYSSPDSGDEAVIAAAKLAGAYDFIVKLENGFNTVTGEIGRKLSGGERQKIAIARAILKKADVIILDEATSNLDMDSTANIESQLGKIFKDKTIIIITHHYKELCLKVDKVIELKNGRAYNSSKNTFNKERRKELRSPTLPN